MQDKNTLRFRLPQLFLIVFFLILSHKGKAQARMIDAAEMKDSVNGYVSRIKQLEKEANPDSAVVISKTREKFVVMTILNLNAACGSLPSPGSKMEVLDAYWKCLFDKAPYGKKFYLNL